MRATGKGTGIIIEEACPCCDITPRLFVWSPIHDVACCKRCYLPCVVESPSALPPLSPEWLPAFSRYFHLDGILIFQSIVWESEFNPERRARAKNLQEYLDAQIDLWPKPPTVSSIRVFECVRGPDGNPAFTLAFPMEDPRPVEAVTIEAADVGIGQCVAITVGPIE